MSLSTIAKKDSNMSSFTFFITINCKVSDGSSRYETILEKLGGQKRFTRREIFLLEENRGNKMDKDPRNKKHDETPLKPH
jgi:hypothetical protein